MSKNLALGDFEEYDEEVHIQKIKRKSGRPTKEKREKVDHRKNYIDPQDVN